MRRQPSTVEPRPYTDAELVDLEATARTCDKVVKLVFPDGSVIEREDHIGIDRAMVIAFCRDIQSLRGQLVEHDRLADETVALLRAAIDLGNKQLAEATAQSAVMRATLVRLEDALGNDPIHPGSIAEDKRLRRLEIIRAALFQSGPIASAAKRLGISGADFLAEAKKLGISLSADDLAELEESRG